MLLVQRNVNDYWLGAWHRNRVNFIKPDRLVRLFGILYPALPARLSALTLRCRPLSRALVNRAGGR